MFDGHNNTTEWGKNYLYAQSVKSPYLSVVRFLKQPQQPGEEMRPFGRMFASLTIREWSSSVILKNWHLYKG